LPVRLWLSLIKDILWTSVTKKVLLLTPALESQALSLPGQVIFIPTSGKTPFIAFSKKYWLFFNPVLLEVNVKGFAVGVTPEGNDGVLVPGLPSTIPEEQGGKNLSVLFSKVEYIKSIVPAPGGVPWDVPSGMAEPSKLELEFVKAAPLSRPLNLILPNPGFSVT